MNKIAVVLRNKAALLYARIGVRVERHRGVHAALWSWALYGGAGAWPYVARLNPKLRSAMPTSCLVPRPSSTVCEAHTRCIDNELCARVVHWGLLPWSRRHTYTYREPIRRLIFAQYSVSPNLRRLECLPFYSHSRRAPPHSKLCVLFPSTWAPFRVYFSLVNDPFSFIVEFVGAVPAAVAATYLERTWICLERVGAV